jgi:hypothetical protein
MMPASMRAWPRWRRASGHTGPVTKVAGPGSPRDWGGATAPGRWTLALFHRSPGAHNPPSLPCVPYKAYTPYKESFSTPASLGCEA